MEIKRGELLPLESVSVGSYSALPLPTTREEWSGKCGLTIAFPITACEKGSVSLNKIEMM